MSEKLKPCPFCGVSDAYHYELRVWNCDNRWCVVCASCMAEGPTVVGRGAATVAWNRRVTLTSIDGKGGR